MYEMIETFMRNRPIFHLGHIVQDLMQKGIVVLLTSKNMQDEVVKDCLVL
jgi:hypothetical protein